MYDEVKLSFHDKKNALNREIYSILLHMKIILKIQENIDWLSLHEKVYFSYGSE